MLESGNKNEIKIIKFVLVKDLLIAVDSCELMYLWDIKTLKLIEKINFNFNCNFIYIPNFNFKDFDNDLMFLSTSKGDILIYDLKELKFQAYSLPFSIIENYLVKAKKKFNNIYNEVIIDLRLHPLDYNILYVIYQNLGFFVVNLSVILII